MKQRAAAFIICFCEAGCVRQAWNPCEQTAGSVSTSWRICCRALEQRASVTHFRCLACTQSLAPPCKGAHMEVIGEPVSTAGYERKENDKEVVLPEVEILLQKNI